MKLFDQIMKCHLLPIETKTTGSLIYLVNNVFLIHDVFLGTPLAKRMLARSKALLTLISKRGDKDED